MFLFVLYCIVSFRSFCTVPFPFGLYCYFRFVLYCSFSFCSLLLISFRSVEQFSFCFVLYYSFSLRALYCVILFFVILYVQEHKSNVSLPRLHACNANYLAITFVLSLSSSSRSSESEFESELSSLESLLTEFDKQSNHDINI